jgi:hypothetical protein
MDCEIFEKLKPELQNYCEARKKGRPLVPTKRTSDFILGKGRQIKPAKQFSVDWQCSREVAHSISHSISFM